MADLLNIYKQMWILTPCSYDTCWKAPRGTKLAECEARTQLSPLLVDSLLGYSHTFCQGPLGGWELPAGGCVKVQMCTCLFTNIKNTSKTVSCPIWVHEWGNTRHRSPDDLKVGMNQCLWKHHMHACSKCVELFKDFFRNVSMKTNLSTTLLSLSDLHLMADVTAPPTALECEGSLNEWNRYHLHQLNQYNLLNKTQTTKMPTAVLTQAQSHKWWTDAK